MKEQLLAQTELSQSPKNWFKQESLKLLASQLAITTYPGYPANQDRLWLPVEDSSSLVYPLVLPIGTWETSGGEVPPIPKQIELMKKGYSLDAYGRPLHPWFEAMVCDPAIGVATGKGAYRSWGPNYTADAIAFRHDLDESRVLLVKRRDSGLWALPGGFIDPGEDSLAAALREVGEETQHEDQTETTIPLSVLNPLVQPVYSGVLADLRVTANAWPETTAYRFDLADDAAANLPIGPYAVRDVDRGIVAAAWLPLDYLPNVLFGSHRLLIDLSKAHETGGDI